MYIWRVCSAHTTSTSSGWPNLPQPRVGRPCDKSPPPESPATAGTAATRRLREFRTSLGRAHDQMKLTGLPSAFGNFLTVIILLAADLTAFLPKFLAYKAVGLIDFATGSGANTVRAKVAWHPQRFATTPVLARLPAVGTGFGELDVPKTMAASTFPLKPDDIIARAKAVLAAEVRHAERALPWPR